jgi:hypothetical protein
MRSIARLLWTATAITACGRVSFEPIELSGQAVVPAQLDLGARCGAATGTTGTIEIENAGDADLEVFSADASNGFVVLTQTPIVVAPGARAKVDVQAPAAVIGTDVPGSLKSGVLTLTLNDGLATVDLTATVTGAELAVTSASMPGAPLVLDLQGSSGSCPNVIGGILENTGGGTAVLSLAASAGFAITGFSGGTLAESESSSFSVRAITNGPCSGVGTISYTATGDVCSTTPTVLTATFVITGSSSCLCS